MKDFKIDAVVVVCIASVLLAAIISYAYIQINDKNLMAKNISDAITAGVNPLSVRCSYSKDNDTICVAYSFSGKSSAAGGK